MASSASGATHWRQAQRCSRRRMRTYHAISMLVREIVLIKLVGSQWVEEDCEQCKSNEGGTALECGESKVRDTSVVFEFTLDAFFVKQGKIEILYRKDSIKEEDGFISGVLEFYMGNDIIYTDSDF